MSTHLPSNGIGEKMLMKVDKSGYPPELVDFVNSYRATIKLIANHGDEDSVEGEDPFEKKYNGLPPDRQRIVDELLRSPDYEEAPDEMYDTAEELAIKLQNAGFSHKQISQGIIYKLNVKLEPKDTLRLHKLYQHNQDKSPFDRDLEAIPDLSDDELKEIISVLGQPRGEYKKIR